MASCRYFLLYLIILFSTPQLAFATYVDKRALVIGNANYSSLPQLDNTVNDAKAIEQKLSGLGFEVDLLVDASLQDMQRGLAVFAEKLDSDTISLVYYAGHGVQEEGVNYLIPSTADIQQSWQLKSSTISMDTILNALDDSLSPLKMIMLDACRDNPFKDNRRLSRTLRSKAGLAQFVSTSGTIVSYATAPDRVAYDGNPGDRNSPYTTALLEHISTPGIKVGEMLNRVGKDVRQTTAGKQEPWQSSSPIDDFCFAGCLNERDRNRLEAELDRIVTGFRLADYSLLSERLELTPEQTERLAALFEEYESIRVAKTRSIKRNSSSNLATIKLELEQALGQDGRVVVPGPRWNTINLKLRQTDGRWKVNKIENDYLLPVIPTNRIDVRAPNIVVDTGAIEKDNRDSVRILSDVLDDVGISGVSLYYREAGSSAAYSVVKLRRDSTNGRYVALIDNAGAKSGQIEIYLEATDTSENLTRWPAPRNPLVINISSATPGKPHTSNVRSNRWMWIGLGVLAVGIAAAAAGGDSDPGEPSIDDDLGEPRPITVTAPLR